MPQSTPSIDRFTIDQATGRAEFDENTPSCAADGNPDNGLITTTAPTGETLQGRDGHPLAADANSYDPDGIIALTDGTLAKNTQPRRTA